MAFPRPDWLLLPLLVLPFAGAAAFCAYVRADYHAEIEAARTGTASLSFSLTGLDADFSSALRLAPEPGDIDVDWAGTPVRVRLDAAPAGPWRFTEDFPRSLGPSGISNEQVRLEVERGTPPVKLPALAAEARLFAELYRAPDLARLAAAPFPLETKAFLLRRRSDATAKDLLDALRHAGPLPDRAGARGAWLRSGQHTPLLWLNRPRFAASFTERNRGRLRLHYAAGALPNTLWPWRGDELPLSGGWGLEAVHGGRWWRDALFLRWAGPVGLAAAGLALIPVLIWLAMRRQRRLDVARVLFITEIAHDLRTPLTALRVQAELLERGVPEARRERHVRRIAGEAGKLSRLLANLLDLTRLERGARVFEIEDVDVPAIATGAARDFAAAWPERASDLALSGGPLRVRADPTALRRCLDNLLDNAAKFTNPGTPIRVEWQDGSLDVADEGPGIEPEEQTRLFRRYQRGAGARAAAVPGTGLGLALVRELARGMGGEARFIPSKSGARFRIELGQA